MKHVQTRIHRYLGPMIIGHMGLALAARARERDVPLVALTAATFAPDLVRAALLLGGVGRNSANIYSHALPWSLILATVLAAIAWMAWRDRTAAATVGLLVLSHVALDMVSGHKALWSGGPSGLNLGDLQQYEFVFEGALFCLGWTMLHRTESNRWIVRRPALAIALSLEAAYLAWAFTQRPYATRCIEHPFRPCWVRRGERAPDGNGMHTTGGKD